MTAADPPRTFESFFHDEGKRLLRALFLLTGNAEEAEEILQDAFLALWERWDRVATMDDPTGYLYRTAMNRHRSLARRAARTSRRALGRAHGGDAFAYADERDAAARALATLTTRRRQAVIVATNGCASLMDFQPGLSAGPAVLQIPAPDVPDGCAEVAVGYAFAYVQADTTVPIGDPFVESAPMEYPWLTVVPVEVDLTEER